MTAATTSMQSVRQAAPALRALLDMVLSDTELDWQAGHQAASTHKVRAHLLRIA